MSLLWMSSTFSGTYSRCQYVAAQAHRGFARYAEECEAKKLNNKLCKKNWFKLYFNSINIQILNRNIHTCNIKGMRKVCNIEVYILMKSLCKYIHVIYTPLHPAFI